MTGRSPWWRWRKRHRRCPICGEWIEHDQFHCAECEERAWEAWEGLM